MEIGWNAVGRSIVDQKNIRGAFAFTAIRRPRHSSGLIGRRVFDRHRGRTAAIERDGGNTAKAGQLARKLAGSEALTVAALRAIDFINDNRAVALDPDCGAGNRRSPGINPTGRNGTV